MKSVVHGLTLAAVAGVVLSAGCEKTPSGASAKSPVKESAVSQTAATTEPAAPKTTPPAPSTPAAAPAAAPANPIAAPKDADPSMGPPQNVDPANLPPSLGTATLKDGVMTVAGVNLTVPEGWTTEDVGTATIRPAMKFKLAAPAGTSIEPGTVNVFAGIKGTPEQNLQRWLLQMNNLEGKPEKEQYPQNGLTITRFAAVGLYNPGLGMGPGGRQTKENWAMFGLVISGGPEGDVHILARGPKEILIRQRPQWDAFTKSATPVKPIEAAPDGSSKEEKPSEAPAAGESKAAG